MIILISEYLSMGQIFRFMRVGKRFYRILQDDQIWKRFTGDMKLIEFPEKNLYKTFIKASKRTFHFKYYENYRDRTSQMREKIKIHTYFGTMSVTLFPDKNGFISSKEIIIPFMVSKITLEQLKQHERIYRNSALISVIFRISAYFVIIFFSVYIYGLNK